MDGTFYLFSLSSQSVEALTRATPPPCLYNYPQMEKKKTKKSSTLSCIIHLCINFHNSSKMGREGGEGGVAGGGVVGDFSNL